MAIFVRYPREGHGLLSEVKKKSISIDRWHRSSGMEKALHQPGAEGVTTFKL